LATPAAESIHDHFEARGHHAKLLAVGAAERLDPDKLGHADALVVVGGDGTVNHTAAAAIDTAVPLYHAPTGNENLFARALGMSRQPAAVVGAIEGGRTAAADVGMCAGRPFLITAGFGPDAGVIRRLAARRTRAIGHLAYAEPLLREALHPHLPRVWAAADGVPFVEGRRGILVIGNSREYASHLDPCPRASLFSGSLDATFMPARTTVGVARWAVSLWASRAGAPAPGVPARGTTIQVRLTEPLLIQLDGELVTVPEGTDEITVHIRPRTLRVVLGAEQERAVSRHNGQFRKNKECSGTDAPRTCSR